MTIRKGVTEMWACFEVILKMSLTASFVIAAVFLIRLLLVRAPRRYSYLLWLIVLIRLLCPAALETRFGAVPDMARIFGEDRDAEDQNTDDAFYAGRTTEGVQFWNGDTEGNTQVTKWQGSADPGNISLPDGYDGWELFFEEMQHPEETRKDAAPAPDTGWVSAAAEKVVGICWLCGCLIFLGYGIAGYLRLSYRLRRKEKQFVPMQNDVCPEQTGGRKVMQRRRVRVVEDSGIGAPFTAGILRPVICLPKRLLPFQREMVLAHEKTHIRRQDNLLKLLAYTARCIHWFNPLVWLAFRCFEEDMETSCDEAVLKDLGYERRKDYAKTLLALSGCGKEIGAFYPVSFGGKNTKARIRNVLSVKKTRVWVALVSAAIVIVSAAVLLVDHKSAETVREPADGQAVSGAQDVVDDWQRELEAQQETINALEAEILRQKEDLLAEEGSQQDAPDQEPGWAVDRQEELEEQVRALEAQEEMFEAQQEIVRALEAELRAELARAEMMARISDGTLLEGDIHLEESMGYASFSETDQAVTVVNADGVCALLCNPQTEWEENGGTVEYFCPIAGVSEGSVFVAGTYGTRYHPIKEEASFHSGIDLAAAKGTPIHAVADGCVYRTGFDEENGNYVIVIHGNGEVTYYAHCESVSVHAGEFIERGAQIATVGSTGKSTGAHLHFAVSRQGMFILPQFADVDVALPDESVQVIPAGSGAEGTL